MAQGARRLLSQTKRTRRKRTLPTKARPDKRTRSDSGTAARDIGEATLEQFRADVTRLAHDCSHLGEPLLKSSEIPEFRLDALPVVSAGTDVTLTVKEIISDTIDGTRETEITVNDFEATNQLLGRLGLHPKSYQENHRTSFLIEHVRLEIDRWPLIPPYLEIEGDTTADVIRIAGLLGYSSEDLTAENTIKIYRRYGYELNDLPELRFPLGPTG